MRTVVVGHTVFTLAMFGLMWTVQIVVYPQFRSVAPGDFTTYVSDHSTRIVAALALLAPAEVGFAAWLFLDPPDGIGRWAALASGCLLAIGWLGTALWYAPLHGRLQASYRADHVDRLIATNWVRTALWSARAGFATWFLWRALDIAA